MTPPEKPQDAAQEADDSTLALAVARTLRAQLGPAARGIVVDVSEGLVTLRGEVDWEHERHDLAVAVAALPGARAVDDKLTLRVRAAQPELASSIQRVLVGLALDDARQVQISLEGSVVRLSGRVHSASQRETAVRAVAEAPGVSRVIDELQVIE